MAKKENKMNRQNLIWVSIRFVGLGFFFMFFASVFSVLGALYFVPFLLTIGEGSAQSLAIMYGLDLARSGFILMVAIYFLRFGKYFHNILNANTDKDFVDKPEYWQVASIAMKAFGVWLLLVVVIKCFSFINMYIFANVISQMNDASESLENNLGRLDKTAFLNLLFTIGCYLAISFYLLKKGKLILSFLTFIPKNKLEEFKGSDT